MPELERLLWQALREGPVEALPLLLFPPLTGEADDIAFFGVVMGLATAVPFGDITAVGPAGAKPGEPDVAAAAPALPAAMQNYS